MRLIRLAVGSHWTVYAVCAADGTCPLLDLVVELSDGRGDAILSDLREHVPNTPSKNWSATEFSKAFKGWDGIYEFRWPTGKGGTPRVLWFYEAGRLVVCSHGVNKKGKLSDDELKATDVTKKRYEAALGRGELEVIDYDTYREEFGD